MAGGGILNRKATDHGSSVVRKFDLAIRVPALLLPRTIQRPHTNETERHP
jgi:hypothetical protein